MYPPESAPPPLETPRTDKLNLRVTIDVKAEAKRQVWPFQQLRNRGDAFLVTFHRADCKYERRYWQVKLRNAANYWQDANDMAIVTKSVPGKGILVVRTDVNYRLMESQIEQ